MQVADLLNAPIDSVVFTAGGTEADNLAIFRSGAALQHSPAPDYVFGGAFCHRTTGPAAGDGRLAGDPSARG